MPRFYLDRIDVLASGDPVAERALTRQVYLPLVANTTDSANQTLEMVNGACSTCASTIQPVVSPSGSIYVQAIKARPAVESIAKPTGAKCDCSRG